jgi:proline dehydrogenase
MRKTGEIMAIAKQSVSETEKSEDDARLSGQRQKAEVMSLVEGYINTIENVWDAPEQEKLQAMQKLGLLLRYSIALVCPVPSFLFILGKDDKEKAIRNLKEQAGEANNKRISLPRVLQEKVAKVAKVLNCSENEAASTVLSESIDKYLEPKKKGVLSDDAEEQMEGWF